MVKRIKAGDSMPSVPAHKALGQAAGRLSAADTLVNLTTGMGGEKDKLAGTIFGYNNLDKGQLDAAYRGDWISRKVVDIPAYDAFREWREWQADKNDITAIEDLEKKLKVQRKSMLALQRGRLYGGGALILGVDQGTSDQPLDIDKLGKDCLKFVHYVSRWEISAGTIDWDIMSPFFGEPSVYTRSGDMGARPMQLHPSRVIRFLGHETADIHQTQGWGDSILQVCADAILSCGTVASSVAQLVAEAKVDVIKIPELSENIAGSEYEDRLKKRFGAASTIKSVFSMLIIDKEEEWERINQTFTGLPDILKMYLLIVSGAADIPATRMLGQSPAGLSATGDSDIRNYYDRIGTEQTVVIEPAMERLDRILKISALGKDDAEIFYEWRPLWQMDPKESAEIAVKKAQVMTADVNAGLITPLVLQKSRENQLIEDGTYPGLEGFIDDFGDDIDERPVELPGMPGAPQAANSNTPAPTNPNPQAGNKNQSRIPAGGAPPGKETRPPLAPRRVAGDMAARMRDGTRLASDKRTPFSDASTPRTLYMRRDVKNQDQIKAWAKSAGFATSLDDMHVTILYSKTAVDWLKVGDGFGYNSNDDGSMTVKPGGPRVLEKFGKAIVLAFANTDLQYRHMSIMNNDNIGASYDYDEYTPHVTITYDGGDLDIMHIAAYSGPIELGPEIFEEIDSGFNNETMTTESDYLGDFNPNHDPHSGQFSGSGGGDPATRSDLVHHLAAHSKEPLSELKQKHQLIPSETSLLRKLRGPNEPPKPPKPSLRKKKDSAEAIAAREAVADAIAEMPAPQIDVHVQVDKAGKVKKETIKVLKRDAQSRPTEIEKTITEEDE